MKALVTGASGFVGGVVCAQLREGGHEVVALVRREGSEPAGTTPARGDLTDASSLGRTLDDHAPDVVFHLAAALASERDDARVRDVNLEGTRRLIDAAIPENGDRVAPKIVFASTVVTGDAGGRVLTEDEPLPVATAYGESKQAGERMLRDSALPCAIVRPGHVYGPGGWYAEEIVKRLQQPGRLAVVGKGDNLWDVVRVEDVAAALVAAAEAAGDVAAITALEPAIRRAKNAGLRPARRAPPTRSSSASSAGSRATRPPARECPMQWRSCARRAPHSGRRLRELAPGGYARSNATELQCRITRGCRRGPSPGRSANRVIVGCPPRWSV
jgi:nucleoside-diphosphate-sugar epimerase